MYTRKIEIEGVGVLEFVFETQPTDQDLKEAIIKAIKGIGGRPNDRG